MASILIVDDDAAMRDALSEAARDLGHDAHLAASGAEAMSLLETQSIDAALLDLRMSGMDGIRGSASHSRSTEFTAGHGADRPRDRRQHDRRHAARRVRSSDEADRPRGAVAGGGGNACRRGGARRVPTGTAAGRIDRVERVDANGAKDHRHAGRQQRNRAHLRRDRDRQGARGARDLRPWSSRRQAVHPRQLRRHPGRPHGKRAVRPRPRRLHGRHQRPEGRLPRSRAWNPVSRRDRRHGHRHAGEDPARAAKSASLRRSAAGPFPSTFV